MHEDEWNHFIFDKYYIVVEYAITIKFKRIKYFHMQLHKSKPKRLKSI